MWLPSRIFLLSLLCFTLHFIYIFLLYFMYEEVTIPIAISQPCYDWYLPSAKCDLSRRDVSHKKAVLLPYDGGVTSLTIVTCYLLPHYLCLQLKKSPSFFYSIPASLNPHNLPVLTFWNINQIKLLLLKSSSGFPLKQE